MKRYRVYICGGPIDSWLPGPPDDRRAMGCAGHTASPPGYTEWFEWAEAMAKTHRQVHCPECGLLSIWVPKETTAETKRCTRCNRTLPLTDFYRTAKGRPTSDCKRCRIAYVTRSRLLRGASS